MIEPILSRLLLMFGLGAIGFLAIKYCHKYAIQLNQSPLGRYFLPHFPDPEVVLTPMKVQTWTNIWRHFRERLGRAFREPTQFLSWDKVKILRKNYCKENFWGFANSFIFCEISVAVVAVGLSIPQGNFDWWSTIAMITYGWIIYYGAMILGGYGLKKLMHLNGFDKTVMFIGCRANAYLALPIILAVYPKDGLTVFALVVLVDETLGYLIQCFFIMPCAENRLLVLLKNPPTWGVLLFIALTIFGIQGEKVPILRELAAAAPWIVPVFIASNLYWALETQSMYYKNNQARDGQLRMIQRAAGAGAFLRLVVGIASVIGAYALLHVFWCAEEKIAICHAVYVSGFGSQIAFLLLEYFSPKPKLDTLVYLTSFAYQVVIALGVVGFVYIVNFIMKFKILL